nr:hypothetical protein Iba_chr02cCG12760 [Ipomoea batatas]
MLSTRNGAALVPRPTTESKYDLGADPLSTAGGIASVGSITRSSWPPIEAAGSDSMCIAEVDGSCAGCASSGVSELGNGDAVVYTTVKYREQRSRAGLIPHSSGSLTGEPHLLDGDLGLSWNGAALVPRPTTESKYDLGADPLSTAGGIASVGSITRSSWPPIEAAGSDSMCIAEVDGSCAGCASSGVSATMDTSASEWRSSAREDPASAADVESPYSSVSQTSFLFVGSKLRD